MIAGVLCGLTAITLVGAAWYYLPLPPFLDDGPFHGEPAAPVTYRPPDQRFAIYNGMALEVFDPPSEDESPTIQLMQRDGTIRWTIRADGFKSGDVESVRFIAHRRGLARCGQVQANVQWTYGHEASTWFITGDGELRDYWYSW